MLDELGIRKEHTEVALNVLPPISSPKQVHVILFAGHMIDEPDRSKPSRFPGDKKYVDAARAKVREEVENEVSRVQQAAGDVKILGITGGACGGDLLFQEVCIDLGLEARLYLPFSREDFFQTSVRHGGQYWIDSYNKVLRDLPSDQIYQLQDTMVLPDWLKQKEDYSVWERNNQWMIHHACAEADGVTLIALWDGLGQDGEGGTKDMVTQAQVRGARFCHINTRDLFEGL